MGLSIAYRSPFGVIGEYIPFRHPGEGNAADQVRLRVKEVIENAPYVAYHHAKFDLPSLATLGIVPKGEFFDSLLMAQLINENKPWNGKTLEALCNFYLGEGIGKEMPPEVKEAIAAFGWHMISAQLMYHYGKTDAIRTYELVEKLFVLLSQELGGDLTIWKHKQDLVHTLIRMKQHGVKVDADKCREMVTLADSEMERLTKVIGFKPTDTAVGNYFIKELKLPVLLWTKWNKTSKTPEHEFVPKPSFTAAALKQYEEMVERLYPGNETVKAILAYRGWQKSRSSFYQSWLDHMGPDGRIRPNYIMHKDPDDGGTVTGRLSCRDPNLQQIPRITNKPWNQDVKPCLIPEPGYVLVEVDYSQLELRLSTAYAREESLIRVFEENRDIFTEMAARMGLTRDATKTFVYSTQYGAGINRISTVFNISTDEAAGIRDNYFRQYPGFRAFSLETSARAKQTGRIRIWSGRYRHFLKPQEEAHKAMNSCIQGGAADIVERIMVKCDKTFVDDVECRMLLQIHDALIFEIKKERLDHYLPIIKSTMVDVDSISPQPFGVKFAVDAHLWGTKEQL